MKNLNSLFLCVLVLAGCQKDLFHNGNIISVKVSASYNTKSAATTTSSLQTSGGFMMDAWLDDKSYDKSGATPVELNQHYIQAGSTANVVMSSGKWQIVGEPCWVADTKTRFWCWHPIEVNGREIDDLSAGATSLSFSYKIPTPSATKGATNSQDLIFAYAAQEYKEILANSSVDITFHHALSQIRFAVSTTDGSFDSRLKIKNISIDNIFSSGDCVFTGDGSGTGSFVWSNQDDFISHETLPSVEPFGENYDASFKTVPVSGWTSGTYSTTSGTFDIQTCTNAFYMIPQTLTSAATITVVFEDETMDPDEATISVTKPLGTDTWEADKYYTYKIAATVIGRKIHMDIILEEWSDREDSLYI